MNGGLGYVILDGLAAAIVDRTAVDADVVDQMRWSIAADGLPARQAGITNAAVWRSALPDRLNMLSEDATWSRNASERQQSNTSRLTYWHMFYSV